MSSYRADEVNFASVIAIHRGHDYLRAVLIVSPQREPRTSSRCQHPANPEVKHAKCTWHDDRVFEAATREMNKDFLYIKR